MPPRSSKRAAESESAEEENSEENESTKRGTKRSNRVRADSDEDDEEYELNEENESNNNDDSDEDGEAEFDEAEFDDGFGADFIGDESDRAYMESLPDLKREEILYERSQKREKLQEARAARLRAAEKSRSAGRATRSATKGKTRGATKLSKNDALGDLLARRKGKVAGKITDSISYEDAPEDSGESQEDSDDSSVGPGKRRKTKAQRNRRRTREQEDYYDESAGEASEAEVADELEDEFATRTPIRLQDVINVQLRRSAVEKIYQEPYFSEFAVGMFTRVTVGQKQGVVDYRLCEVTEVTNSAKDYLLNGHKTFTVLKLRCGRSEKIFPLTSISNHSVMQPEFDYWSKEMEKCGLTPMTMEEAIAKHKKAVEIRERFTYTAEIVSSVIERKRLEGKLQMNPAVEKTKLNYELLEAKQKNLTGKADDVKKRLNQIDAKEKEIQERKLQKSMTGISAINSRAREQNEQDLHSMIKLEREEKKKNSGKAVKPDAFRRRATRPEMSWNSQEEEKKEEKKEIKVEAETKKIEDSEAVRGAEQKKIQSLLTDRDGSSSSGGSHSIVPPSIVDPSLDSSNVLNIPHLPAAELNRSLLSSIHSFPLEIDFSIQPKSVRSQQFALADNKYSMLPAGSKSLTLEEYWQRRDQEEEQMQQ